MGSDSTSPAGSAGEQRVTMNARTELGKAISKREKAKDNFSQLDASGYELLERIVQLVQEHFDRGG